MQTTNETVLEARHYEILSSASFAELHEHVLRFGETFVVLDQHGDITRVGNGELGLYHEGTRYLSRQELWMGKVRPVLLNSAVRRDNSLLTANLTNPDFQDKNGRVIPHGTLHLARSKLVAAGSLHERLRISNFGATQAGLSFSFVFDADYADIFEVRGTKRERRGERLPTEETDDGLVLSYVGLDDLTRRTSISFKPLPSVRLAREFEYDIELDPGEECDITVAVVCGGEVPLMRIPHADAVRMRLTSSRSRREEACRITTSDARFNGWIERSLEDVNFLLQEVPDGHYPYAGIPWYNTFFGRDGILTAMMTLWVNPLIARGVLGYLASTQADQEDPDAVAEPGKILHESRKGEMARLGEIPFRRYYGTVDATPLFVMLAGIYYEHTGDIAFIRSIWPNIIRALNWIDEYGDIDGDGFVEYRAHGGGLTQQGWKDSEDSIFHADGTLAAGPIALCEVQGYVFAAKKRASRLAEVLGEEELSQKLRRESTRIQQQFEDAFWCEEMGSYALALDGEKRPCRVRASNAGHALFTEIADPNRAMRVSEALFSRDMYCGWGIRTLSSKERRYNPMSYHNGSVWPHDNALIGWGLARYRLHDDLHRLIGAFFDASLFEPLQRLPELFCGFIRRKDEGPTPYPVACSPQAWAAASLFYLLQASCGLRVYAAKNEVHLQSPSLPPFLQEIKIENLKVGDGCVDLVLQRYARSVGVEVTRREGGVKVVTVT